MKMNSKYFVCLLAFCFFFLNTYSQTITALGMAFSPDTINCNVGDTITFQLAGTSHNAVEISESDWLNNIGSNPIGGINIGTGQTNMFTPITPRTYYYICQPHAAIGMKGVIIANNPPVLGCTNAAACNYNPLATQDDGSCN